MIEQVKINGNELSNHYGWVLEEGNYAQLLRSPKMKDVFTYNWPDQAGEDYDERAIPVPDVQDFNIALLIVAGDRASLFEKYNRLINDLKDPLGTDWEFIELDKTFRLHFLEVPTFEDFDLDNGSAKIVISMRNRHLSPRVIPEAPTAIAFDELLRQINFVLNPEYSNVEDYEFTIDGGVTWSELETVPFGIGTGGFAANKIAIRVKALNGDLAGYKLYYTQAIKAYVSAPTNFVWNQIDRVLDFTYTTGFEKVEQYELSFDNGANWGDLTSKPIVVPNEFYSANAIQLRVKEGTLNLASASLKYNTAIKILVNAPSGITFDDNLRKLDFTFNPLFINLTDYEVTKNGGLAWGTLTAKPYQVDQEWYLANKIGFRVSETATYYASAPVYYDQAIVSTRVMENFINSLQTDGTYTYDASLLQASWSGLPIKPNSGLVLLPTAHKVSSIAMVNVANNGSVINAPFSRAGKGWAVLNNDIVESDNSIARLDDFYYSNDKGYLIEGSATNKLTQSSQLVSPNRTTIIQGSGFSLDTPSRVTMGTTTGTQFTARSGSTLYNGTKEDISFFVKNNSSRKVFFASGNSFLMQAWNSVVFDLENETFVTHGESTNYKCSNVTIKNVGNGWFFITLRMNIVPDININTSIILGMCDGGNYQSQSIVGDGVSNFEATNINISNISSPIFTNGSAVTRPAESLQIPITQLTDIWIKSNTGVQIINDVAIGNFNVHNYITNGKLLALIVPMRKFTSAERSELTT